MRLFWVQITLIHIKSRSGIDHGWMNLLLETTKRVRTPEMRDGGKRNESLVFVALQGGIFLRVIFMRLIILCSTELSISRSEKCCIRTSKWRIQGRSQESSGRNIDLGHSFKALQESVEKLFLKRKSLIEIQKRIQSCFDNKGMVLAVAGHKKCDGFKLLCHSSNSRTSI